MLVADKPEKQGRPWRGARRIMIALARPEGLEPPAYRFEACCSIQLSYERHLWKR
jgi:hypothetical protein